MGISHSRQREMSSRSPAVSKKTNGRLNGRAEPEVTEDGLDLNVIDRVQDYLRKISEMTSKVPDQVCLSVSCFACTPHTQLYCRFKSPWSPSTCQSTAP